MHRAYLFLFTLAFVGCAAPSQQAPLQVLAQPAEARSIASISTTPAPTPTPNEELAALPEFQPETGAKAEDILAAKRFFEALSVLEQARKLDPERPEAILNEAILLHEYGPALGGNGAERSLLRAMQLYRLFIQKTKENPGYSEELKTAKERLSWIEGALFCQFRETEADRKKRIAEEKQRQAVEELSPF